jgi:hypothetical protein
MADFCKDMFSKNYYYSTKAMSKKVLKLEVPPYVISSTEQQAICGMCFKHKSHLGYHITVYYDGNIILPHVTHDIYNYHYGQTIEFYNGGNEANFWRGNDAITKDDKNQENILSAIQDMVLNLKQKKIQVKDKIVWCTTNYGETTADTITRIEDEMRNFLDKFVTDLSGKLVIPKDWKRGKGK